MENTKLENWTNRMNEYVKKTSKHLFVDDDKRMFKVIHFKHKNQNMVTTIKFDKDYFWLRIQEIKAVTSESLFEMKTTFFPQWYKTKTIPNFKKMRNVTNIIKNHLESEYDGSADKTLEIKAVIKNLIKNEKFFEKNLTN